jgi:hypothetical protein
LMAINIVEYLTNVPAGDYNEMVSYWNINGYVLIYWKIIVQREILEMILVWKLGN